MPGKLDGMGRTKIRERGAKHIARKRTSTRGEKGGHRGLCSTRAYFARNASTVGKRFRSQAPKGLEVNAVKLRRNTTTRNPSRSCDTHLGERSQKEGILSHVALETGTTSPSVRQAERPWVMQAPHGFQLAISPQGSWSQCGGQSHTSL